MSASFPYYSLVITTDEKKFLVGISANPDQNPQKMIRSFMEYYDYDIAVVGVPMAIPAGKSVYDMEDETTLDIFQVIDAARTDQFWRHAGLN